MPCTLRGIPNKGFSKECEAAYQNRKPPSARDLSWLRSAEDHDAPRAPDRQPSNIPEEHFQGAEVIGAEQRDEGDAEGSEASESDAEDGEGHEADAANAPALRGFEDDIGEPDIAFEDPRQNEGMVREALQAELHQRGGRARPGDAQPLPREMQREGDAVRIHGNCCSLGLGSQIFVRLCLHRRFIAVFHEVC